MSISTVMNNNNTFYSFSVTSHLQRYSQYNVLGKPQCKTRWRTQARLTRTLGTECLFDVTRWPFLMHICISLEVWFMMLAGKCSFSHSHKLICYSPRNDELCYFVVLKLWQCIFCQTSGARYASSPLPA